MGGFDGGRVSETRVYGANRGEGLAGRDGR